MYVNGEMITVETVPGMGGWVKENNEGGEVRYDIFATL
jgi:hypothetical protein